jgi:hypothetical protein
MALYKLANRITGEVPGCDLDLVMWKMGEALGKIYDECDWSFQRTITYANWLCPGELANTGTFTVTPYSNQVIADTTATTVLAGLTAPPFLTTLQYRDPAYSIYNIVGYDTTTNAPYATLTLDRPWLEPTSGPGQPYMIYQAYFVAPCKDFHKFIEIRDTTNSAPIDFWTMTQAELAIRDPQRTEFADPDFCVPAGVDQRPGTSTPGWQMFELWPQQLDYLPYSFSYRKKGKIPETFQDFQTMELPMPVTEQMLDFQTKICLYEYKEAQKDREQARGSGANWLLLAAMAQKRYEDLLDKAIAIDLNLNGEAFTRLPGRAQSISNAAYSNQLGQLNVGGYPERGD